MKGNLAWETLIELFLIAMIAVLIIATSSSADAKAIKESILVKDLGLSLSLVSFIPGNFQYVYTLPRDKSLDSWSDKRLRIRFLSNKIEYGDNYFSYYSFYLKNNFPSYSTFLSSGGVNISKTVSFSTDYSLKYSCSSSNKFKLYRVKGDVGYYTKSGEEKMEPEVDIVGFETQYFKEGERLYISPLSQKINKKQEYEILKEIAELSNLKQVYDVGYVPPSFKEDIVFIDTEYSSENMIKIFFPKNSFEDSCEVYNGLISSYKSSLIPYDKNYVSVVFSGDESFFTSSNIDFFAKSLGVLNG